MERAAVGECQHRRPSKWSRSLEFNVLSMPRWESSALIINPNMPSIPRAYMQACAQTNLDWALDSRAWACSTWLKALLHWRATAQSTSRCPELGASPAQPLCSEPELQAGDQAAVWMSTQALHSSLGVSLLSRHVTFMEIKLAIPGLTCTSVHVVF